MADLWILAEQVAVERGRRAERKQPDHGPHLESLRLAGGQPEHVIEEAVSLIPHARVVARMRHRRGDPEEMLAELVCHVHVVRFGVGQFHRDLEHVLTEQGHPGRAVGLFEITAGRQGCAAIEDPDVVQAQESTLEDRASAYSISLCFTGISACIELLSREHYNYACS